MSASYRVLLLIASLSFGMAGCNDDGIRDYLDNDNTDKSPLQKYTGEWIEQGSGLALTINSNNVKAYRYTRETCSLVEHFESLQDAEESMTLIRSGETGDQFSFVFQGGSDTDLDRVYLHSQALPVACDNAPDPTVFDPEFIFLHAWHTFNDYYPFFELRDVDWQQQWDVYRPQVTSDTSQQQLFTILQSMLSPIDDGHIALLVETDELEDSFSPAVSRGWAAKVEALAKATNVDEDQAVEAIFDSFYFTVANYYGDGELESASVDNANVSLVWGRLQGNIGYLQINAMEVTDKDGSEISISEQIRLMHQGMDAALNDMADTNGIVVDTRFNGGGSDAVSLVIAGYFTDTRQLAFSRENYNLGSPTPRLEFYIEPNSNINYTKPVVLITGPNTGSAAEVFTLAMSALPDITHIGEPTEGILSDILDVELMNGWELNLSYQRYYSVDNQVYESTGVTPEEEVSVTSYTALDNYRVLPAIQWALIELGVDLSLSQEVFDSEVERIMSTVGIPGFSIAWIDNEGILGADVKGFADVEQGRLVTVDTPFNLGSVSKTVIGTSAMQMLERGLIDADTSLSDLAMPFTVDSPYIDGGGITIIDLATHSSGIREDNLAYFCGYYLEADQSNLGVQFTDIFSVCPDPVETNQSAFLASLLNQSGELYSEAHFNDVEPGEEYRYTNIGSALAAEMLSVASGTSFKNWTENNIFTVLGMNNTHWFNADFTEVEMAPAKRYHYLDREVVVIPEFSHPTWSDGALKASATDMARYLLTIVRGGELESQRILSANSVSLMLSDILGETITEGHQGIFWVNDDFMFGHDGSDPGTVAEMRYDQYNDMGLVLMFNRNDGVSELLGEEPDDIDIVDPLGLLYHLAYRRGLSLKMEKEVMTTQ